MRFVWLTLYGLLRLLIAGAIICAISVQFYTSVIRHDADPVSFFSYFTILSNVFAALVFLISAISLLGGKNKKPSRALEYSRGAATVYMATTGVVYALLLSQYDLGLTLSWVNFILHQLVPVAAILDWILAPPERRLAVRVWLSWLIFPFAYVVYALIRGAIVYWYPYPFLNPLEPGGYERVAAYSLGIAAGITLVIILTGWIGNFLGANRRSKRPVK